MNNSSHQEPTKLLEPLAEATVSTEKHLLAEPADIQHPLFDQLSSADQRRLEKLELARSKYINLPRDKELRSKFNTILENSLTKARNFEERSMTNRREGRSLLLVGNSGAGKTEALKRFFSKHPMLVGYGNVGLGCPLVSILVPPACTLKSLGIAVLIKLGYPLRTNSSVATIWNLVHSRMRGLNVHMLHFDEFQNVTSRVHSREAIAILDMLKTLMVDGEYPVSLVISGLPELLEFFEEDMQNARRCLPVKFESLVEDDAEIFADYSLKLTDAVGIKNEVHEHKNFARRLLHAGKYELGVAVDIMMDAIDLALTEGGDTALTIGHFAAAYKNRTRSAPIANPFLNPRWRDVETRRVINCE